MPSAAQDISAKNFEEPLMKVLGRMTKFDSGRMVNHEDVYTPVCKMMGIDRSQYGNMDDGIPRVEKWIQWAFQNLRTKQWGAKHGRGKWGLTPEGVDMARDMLRNVANEADVLADIIAAMPLEGVAADVGAGGDYHPDPYIRHLALSTHPCMGFFSSQSPVCPKCSARTLCVNQMYARMAALATDLDNEDQVSKVVPATGPKPGSSSGKFKIPEGAWSKPQICQGQVVCTHCRGIINKGDPAVWVRNLGPDKKGSAMLHQTCIEE